MIRLHAGDCREILKTLAADSFDACVTDPPYELAFMGKAWDSTGVAFDPATWREVFRVLKPGAHLLAFGGTRTSHRMVCAIEDAGFEIRDGLGWLYGSGFPKSLDVAKALDRRKDWQALPELQKKIRAARDALGISQSEAARRCGLIGPDEQLGGGGFMWFETGMRIPTAELYARIKSALLLDDSCDAAFQAAEREVVGFHEREAPGFVGERFSQNDRTITANATDLARAWAGWGTALKPAWEPVCMARKPFRGTVAENVARHGVGAINVDGCRIDGKVTSNPLVRNAPGFGSDGLANQGATGAGRESLGRWPANILHDGSDEVLAVFPESDGATTVSRSGKVGLFDDGIGPSDLVPGYADTGSAARFFYCAKVSPAERDDGLAHLDPVAFARSSGAQSKIAAGLDNQGAGAVGLNKVQQVRNTHPTVKPTDLMAYLCRLVTPPGGTVLDPFCGSGSTGRGAVREQFHFVGIDLDPQNIAIAEARIHAAAPLFARAAE